MSLFWRPQSEQRSWDVLRDFAHGGTSTLESSMQAALRLAPVYAATSYIADTFSILPLSAYTTRSGNRVKLDPQPQLVLNPHVHSIFTRVEWLHQGITSWLLRGNAYGVITDLDAGGIPSQIAWLHPDSVRVDETKPIPEYWHGDKRLNLDTLIHIPWYPQPGSIVGLSPISLFRQQIETGNAAVGWGHNYFQAGSVPSGHLKYGAGPLDPEQSAAVKARFKEAVRGNDFFVSGNDWEWQSLSIKPDEAQFLQTIKASANLIAAIYRVPPEEIGGEATVGSLTYNTVEMAQIKFHTRTLQPIFTRWEAHLNRLLPNRQYVKFNADALIRADSKARAETHEINIRTGIETLDEGRALEDKAPMTAAELAAWKDMHQKVAPAAPAQKEDA